MEQYRDSQYDDDLTVGMDEKEELFDTGFVDLFEYSGDDESPIARLKSIVLSIDWEINDEVLTQFNEELIDLKDIWGDDAIKLVYIQALEKIGKYIYQQKSDAHPNAIKLLLGFYYNLEKIVLNDDLDEEEKKEILREDVKKFDQLKQQIGPANVEMPRSGKTSEPDAAPSKAISEHSEASPVLFKLKACILGMDWEITERELSDLSKEIKNLEEQFAGNKPKMLFLQGIGALGGYIKLKKSNAHADAFKLLFSFYEGLEKIVVQDMSLEEEKKILLPEVKKFEAFKDTIASTITPDVISSTEGMDQDEGEDLDGSIAPAFADIPEETKGFQAEEEARRLDETDSRDMEGRLDSFFTDDTEEEPSPPAGPAAPREELPKEAQERIDSFFNEVEGDDFGVSISAEEALKGVDVETEADDDSDEDDLPLQGDGALAPALAESDEEEEHGINSDLTGGELAGSQEKRAVSEGRENIGVEPSVALAGVNVETEADDDSDESPLPKIDDEIAPALFGGEPEESVLAEMEEDDAISDQIADFFGDEDDDAAPAVSSEQTPEDIESRLDSFFGEDVDETEVSDEKETVDIEAGVGSFFDDEESEQLDEEESEEFESEIESFFDEDGDEQDLFRAVPEGEDEPEVALEDTIEDQSLEMATEIEADDSAVFSLSQEDEDEVPSEASEEKDEEITFEAADDKEGDEEDLPEAVLENTESPADSSLSSFGSGSDEQDFFAAIDERVDEPGEFQMEILDEGDEFDDSTVTVTADEASDVQAIEEEQISTVDETIEEEQEEERFTFSSDDNLANLRDGIASLGVEINESIIDGILSEINGLRHKMMTRPVEKTFLQLISTIVQHIGQYGYEASADAHGLLLSVFDKLELVQNAEIQTDQAQEVLLAETSKVLLWQQKMLDRQAVRKGDQLTFIDPVRTDELESDGEDEENLAPVLPGLEEDEAEEKVASGEEDFSAVFEPVEEDDDEIILESDSYDEEEFEQLAEDTEIDDIATALTEEDLFEELDTAEEQGVELEVEEEDFFDDTPMEAETAALQDDALSGDEFLSDDGETGSSLIAAKDPAIADFVKKEIEALRQSLKQEIEELKRQLKEK